MPSSDWRALGRGRVLAPLRTDLRSARAVQIVGPWIDHYFAEVVVDAATSLSRIEVLTRPIESMDPGFSKQACAAIQHFAETGKLKVATLAGLHAKVIVLDQLVVYCGSMNWYRYSLDRSDELVLRGRVVGVPAVLDELASLWGRATEVDPSVFGVEKPTKSTRGGYNEEVLDPIARAKLAEVPGAFVLGRRHKVDSE